MLFKLNYDELSLFVLELSLESFENFEFENAFYLFKEEEEEKFDNE